MLHPMSMSPIAQFPTNTETSRYLPASSCLSYNINDYLPSRVERNSRKESFPSIQLHFSNPRSESIKEYDEKIRVLESRISQLADQREKEVKEKRVRTQNENTQTEVSCLERPKRLGWGERTQITIVPIKKINYQFMTQTDPFIQPPTPSPSQQTLIPTPVPQPSIPKIQIPQLPHQPSHPRLTTRRQALDRYDKPSITQRNKQNISTNRNHLKPFIKDDSVDLYPVRSHEVMDIVRMMLSTSKTD